MIGIFSDHEQRWAAGLARGRVPLASPVTPASRGRGGWATGAGRRGGQTPTLETPTRHVTGRGQCGSSLRREAPRPPCGHRRPAPRPAQATRAAEAAQARADPPWGSSSPWGRGGGPRVGSREALGRGRSGRAPRGHRPWRRVRRWHVEQQGCERRCGPGCLARAVGAGAWRRGAPQWPRAPAGDGFQEVWGSVPQAWWSCSRGTLLAGAGGPPPCAHLTRPPPPAAVEVSDQHHRVLLHVEDHRQIRAAGGLLGRAVGRAPAEPQPAPGRGRRAPLLCVAEPVWSSGGLLARQTWGAAELLSCGLSDLPFCVLRNA